MSRAFVKEDQPEAPAAPPPRAPLPAGVPNYVTDRGLELLRAEATKLALERTRAEENLEGDARTRALTLLSQRRIELEERIASAVLVPPPEDPGEARFGALVTVRGDDGSTRRYRIVGVDEADPASGSIAFVAPLARGLLGKRAGDVVSVRTPRGEEEIELLAVEY